MKIRALLAAGALMLVATAAFAQSFLPQTDAFGNPVHYDELGRMTTGTSTQVRTQDGGTHTCELLSQNQDRGKCTDGGWLTRDGRGGYLYIPY